MATRPTKKMTTWYQVVRIIFLILFVAIIANLFYLQVVMHAEYEKKALNQQTGDTYIAAKRGSILDRNGKELAISASAFKVTLSPTIITKDEDAVIISKALSEALNMDYDKIYEMTKRKVSYVEVKRRIEEDEKLKVNNFLIEHDEYAGIVRIMDDPKRYYPHGNLMSTVLGFVGDDMQGLEGLEMQYDSYLKGSPGKVIVAKTAKGTALPFEYEKYMDPVDGNNINLTIDIEMQYFLEKHIENARVEHNVQNRVAGIIMDVKTGEVLAMSTKPDFDPNNPFSISDDIVLDSLAAQYGQDTPDYWTAYNATIKDLWKNKLCEQYEPGSTFKILTSAMALEEGIVSLTETFNCTGAVKVASETIHCANRKGHGVETFKDGLANSCNPVFMTLASRIGAEKFYNYITIFGLRDKTNVGVPGEQTGYHYRLNNIGIVDLATSAFGQGFKITPLQLISAVCSVANDGTYMQPFIIESIKDQNGNIIKSNSPTAVKQTVSKETSELLCQYLEYAVEKGKKAYLEGYRIAGKTGTSEKLDSGDDTARIASFIGFAPADDPQICCLVVVDEPNSEVQYGSYIAAPLAKDILADAMKHLNIEPDYGEGKGVENITVPVLTGLSVADATTQLTQLGLVAKTVGSGDVVKYQIPGDSKVLPKGSTVMLYTDEAEPSYATTVPKLTGLTAAECNRELLNADLNIKISGSNISSPGVVAVSQSVPEGTTVDKYTVITVEFGTPKG